MKKQSEFGKIKLVDVLNALYYFIGTVGLAWLTYIGVFKVLPNSNELIGMLSTAAIPAFLSIFKSAAKNSEGKLLKSESSDIPRTGGGGDIPPPQR